MKKLAGIAVLAMFGSLVNAQEQKVLLDKVAFQVSAKQWVSTQTALLTVNVNATLNHADLVKARAQIMNRLAKIAPGEWHLTQFERSQDSSGLEKLFVTAEARVLQNNLTNIYLDAKNVSKPGETYTINSIEFKPDLDEVQQVKQQLRERLYQQVNDEISRLNKVYPGQHYTLNNLVFFEGDRAPLPQPKAYQAREINTMVMAAAAPALTVSNELVMSAVVELASNREEGKAVANN
ncbi:MULTISPECIES: hypothetical protein [unclassified Legionella]|uniref:hypothetical protein n=1 Tax=unclassified Legionella TaxID=2622702 RepID=UPI001056B76D|nr:MULTISPECIES: hypothetical protein [unclassified Legionella]MDI9818534.1 hypothetical protein [Legionella sp. PL877]